MPRVTFRAKVEKIYYVDDTLAYERIKIPELKRHHCDMHAFRTHSRYGAYANSDFFPSMLRRAVEAKGLRGYVRLDRVPPEVSIDTTGFLAQVSIEI